MVTLPPDACIVRCRWMYTVKDKPYGSISYHKARLVVKSFSRHDFDYFETFSLVAHLNSIRFLFSLVMNLDRSLFQFDIQNGFLYGDLQGDVYGTISRVCCLEGACSLQTQESNL